MLDETRFFDVRCDDCGTLLARHTDPRVALREAMPHRNQSSFMALSHRCVTCRAFVREWEPADVLDRLTRAFLRHPWCEALVVTDARILAMFDVDGMPRDETTVYEALHAGLHTTQAVSRWLGIVCVIDEFIFPTDEAIRLYRDDGCVVVDLRPLRGKRQQP